MVALGPITSWQPAQGPVTTWTASDASREIMAKADRDPLPPSFQQASHLRAAFYGRALGRQLPRLIMVSWDIPGTCDIAAMTTAINMHVRRHDTYHSSFGFEHGNIFRRTIADPEQIEFTPVSLGDMSTEEIREHAMTTTPGTLEWDCFTFGIIQKADHFTFYASVDHLHIDGMSQGIVFLDIHLAYQDLVTGREVTQADVSGYRSYAARQSERVADMDLSSPEIRDWIAFAQEADGDWPSFPLELGDTSSNHRGDLVTVELLDDEGTEAFDAACRSVGARFSGGVMACAALAEHQLTGNTTYHGFTPSDTRTPGAETLSVGWFASLFPVTVPIGDGCFGDAARAAQQSFDSNRHLGKRALRTGAGGGAGGPAGNQTAEQAVNDVVLPGLPQDPRRIAVGRNQLRPLRRQPLARRDQHVGQPAGRQHHGHHLVPRQLRRTGRGSPLPRCVDRGVHRRREDRDRRLDRRGCPPCQFRRSSSSKAGDRNEDSSGNEHRARSGGPVDLSR